MKKLSSLIVSIFLYFAGTSVFAQPITVVVSILPQAEWVKAVGKEYVSVEVLLPPGASEEAFEPSAKHLARVAKSQLWVVVGQLPFETQYKSKCLALNPKLLIIEAIPAGLHKPFSTDVHETGLDPHTWLSIGFAKRYIEAIRVALTRLNPALGPVFQANATAYIQQLNQAEIIIKQNLSQAPKKKFFIYHPVLGYFASDYGWQQLPIQHNHAEPSPKVMKQVVDTAKKESIKKIVVHPEFDLSLRLVLEKTIQGKAIVFNPFKVPYIDNMVYFSSQLGK